MNLYSFITWQAQFSLDMVPSPVGKKSREESVNLKMVTGTDSESKWSRHHMRSIETCQFVYIT